MNSFSSASHMCEPFPRTINGGSPPTDPNARTGELTPPGIIFSARCCRRRDCSTFRDVVNGIQCPAGGSCQKMLHATDYYSNAQPGQINQIFIVLPSLCNIATVT